MSMCQRGGLLGAVASTWREIDTSSSWTKNSTHFSLAWLSLGAPVLLLLYMVEGSFSAVIPGTPDQDQRLESHQNATSGSAGLRGWLDGGTGAKGGWQGGPSQAHSGGCQHLFVLTQTKRITFGELTVLG